MRPAHPAGGTDNARFLDALVQAYPNAVWSPNSRLNIMAHSRAADLRKLGWNVEAVNRRTNGTGRRREYGYVLKSLPQDVATARDRARVAVGSAALTDPVVPVAIAAERCGLSLEQLRYLDRMGSVPFDVVTGAGHGQYLSSTVGFLQAAGLLVSRGIGLDHAIALLRQHADDLVSALRLAGVQGAA